MGQIVRDSRFTEHPLAHQPEGSGFVLDLSRPAVVMGKGIGLLFYL